MIFIATAGYIPFSCFRHNGLASQTTLFPRFMAPLYVENSCMPCHTKQGYFRGGISVTFDVSGIEKKMARNRFGFIGLGIAAIGQPLALFRVDPDPV